MRLDEGPSILHLTRIKFLQPEAGGGEWQILAASLSKEETEALD